jgi:hypothetical protein
MELERTRAPGSGYATIITSATASSLLSMLRSFALFSAFNKKALAAHSQPPTHHCITRAATYPGNRSTADLGNRAGLYFFARGFVWFWGKIDS